jgi:hypothetical protein
MSWENHEGTVAEVSDVYFSSIVDPWKPDLEDKYDASIYSNGAAAVKALVRKCAAHILEKTQHGQIYLQSEAAPSEQVRVQNMLSIAMDQFVADLPSGQFEISGTNGTEHDEQQLINVTVSVGSLSEKWSAFEGHNQDIGVTNSGECRAKVSIAGIETQFTTNFVERHWLTDYQGFGTVHQGSGYRRILIPTTFAEESDLDRAIDQAVQNRLIAVVESRWEDYKGNSHKHSHIPSRDEIIDAIRDRKNITNGNPIVDRFSQSLIINGQPFWRGAVLIDENFAAGVAHTASTMSRDVQVRHRTMDFGRFLAIFGIFGVVVIGYYAADAATRGYYSPVLAALCVVVFVTVGLILR